MERAYDSYWNWRPGANVFGTKFGMVAGTILKHSDKLGYFVKSPWNDFLINKYLADIDQKNFHELVRLSNYQDWLDFYFRVSKNIFKIENPIEHSIDELRGIYNKRPPWAVTFASKRFKQLPDNMVGFLNPNRNVQFWWIEREKIADSFGKPAVVERLTDVAGRLQRLTVVGTPKDFSGFTFVRREALSEKEFKSDMRFWRNGSLPGFDNLLHMETPILDIL